MSLVVAGHVVALDPGEPARAAPGRVLIGDGLVDRVATPGGELPTGFGGAARVDVGDAWIFPGVIDLHSHLGYNTLPLWVEKSQQTPFLHHNDWTDEASYQASVSWPAWTLARCAPEALLTYVGVKALVGGTTAIQGSPGMSRPRDGWLIRAIDDETFGTGDRNLLFTSALTMTPDQLRGRAREMTSGRGLVYHCAEGQRGSVVTREYDDARSSGALQRRLIAVHTNAVTDYSAWRADPGGIVWSPFSNLWLYGQTTDVPAAMAAGLTVALGSDWAPSGTKHVLGELKVASLWNDQAGWNLTPQELVAMVTANPGDLLSRAWPHPAGRLVPGALGDLTVVTRRSDDPWRDLIATRERDVVLVVVAGTARYGTPESMAGAGAAPSGAITVAGVRRRISIPDPAQPGRQWSWPRVRAALNAVRANPAAALERAERERMQAAAGSGPTPLTITLDMPFGGGPTAGPPTDPESLIIPALESLSHTRQWLARIRDRGFHDGALDGLAGFYR